MKAAVVEAFGRPPVYRDFDEPAPKSGEVAINVRAAALSQLVRAQASGKHYSSKGALQFVPGVDGVGRLDDGRRVYFAFPRSPFGAMAQRTVVNNKYVAIIPGNVDDVTAAAIANPGMSSWAALVHRAKFKSGESVLINGATGVAGKLAIQIAKHMGAGRVVVTGRDTSRGPELLSLGADAYVPLDLPPDELTKTFSREIAAGVDVVLDYLYGPSVERFLAAVGGHGEGEAARRIRFVNIGSLAGQTISLPAGTLRSSGIEMTGSGLGSVSHVDLVASIANLLQAVGPAKLKVDADPVPLEKVETTWNGDASGRVVFTM